MFRLQYIQKYWIVILTLLVKINCVFMQVPYVPCPRNFEYLSDGYRNYGRITLENQQVAPIRLDVHFAQSQRLSNYYGSLTLAYDLESTFNILKRSQKVNYNVEFPDGNIFPQLMLIQVNGQTICRNNAQYPFYSKFHLTHTFTPTIKTSVTSYERLTPENVLPEPFENTINRNLYQDGSGQQLTITYHAIRRTPWRRVPGNPLAERPTTGTTFQLPQFSNFGQWPQPSTISTQFPTYQQQPDDVAFSGSPTFNHYRPEQEASQSTDDNHQYQCGTEGISPFVYGKDLSEAKFPWLSAIYLKSPKFEFRCGGSMITQRTIISAAHCFKTSYMTVSHTNVAVTVGRHDLSTVNLFSNDVRNVIKIAIPSEYSPNGYTEKDAFTNADIALLHLESPVTFSHKLKPVCLWTDSADESMIVGETAVVAGWGAYKNGSFSATPKKADLTIMDRNQCRENSPDLRTFFTRKTICAGNRNGQGPCTGDSGGGLLIFHERYWHLRGIISAGTLSQGQCDVLNYAIYTDVAKHKHWILGNIAN